MLCRSIEEEEMQDGQNAGIDIRENKATDILYLNTIVKHFCYSCNIMYIIPHLCSIYYIYIKARYFFLLYFSCYENKYCGKH